MHEGQAKCGAKRRGKPDKPPCQDIAMANGRCRRHGGKSTGPKDPAKMTGALNGQYSHGVYTKFFRPDEKVLIDENAFKIGQVDDELTVVRVRLKRALEAKELWEAERRGDVEGSSEETSLVLVETEDGEKPFGKDADLMTYEAKKRKLPPFDDIIDRCLQRIESLEKTRLELLDGGGDRQPPDGSGDAASRDHVSFSGGLNGDDAPLPSPFADKPKK